MLRLLRVLAVFVGGTLLSYVLVLVAAFTFWSFVPTPDPTKMIAATVFLVVGPALALAGGSWLAAWAWTGRLPWPVTAWARRREARRLARATVAGVSVPATSAAERGIGWLFVFVGGGGILAGLAALSAFRDTGDPWLHVPAIHLLPVFMLLVVGLLGPAFLGGIGLLRGRVWGRPVVTVTAILLLFVPPVGTAAGVVALAVLHHRRRAGLSHGAAVDVPGPATCVHLAPIETASAAAGLAVTRRIGGVAEIHCTAYPPSLQRLLPAGSPVVLEEWAAPDRSTLDPPRLVLRCTACRSWLVFDGTTAAPSLGPS